MSEREEKEQEEARMMMRYEKRGNGEEW